jgi:hypothetical protein
MDGKNEDVGKNDCAFPVSGKAVELLDGGYGVPQEGLGLTRREYFAAIALQGLLANTNLHIGTTSESYAKAAMHHADALIRELKK